MSITGHHIVSPTQEQGEEKLVSVAKKQPNQKKAPSSTHYKKHFSQRTLFGSKASTSATLNTSTAVRAFTYTQKNGTIIKRKAHLRTISSGVSKSGCSSPLPAVFKASNASNHFFTMEDYRQYFGAHSKSQLICQCILQTSEDILNYECQRRLYLNDLLQNNY
jgi:hypothetical protein